MADCTGFKQHMVDSPLCKTAVGKKSKVPKQTKKSITFSVFRVCSGRSLKQLGAAATIAERDAPEAVVCAGDRLGRAAQSRLSSGEGAAAVRGKAVRASAAAAAAAAPAPAQFPLSPALTLRAHAHCARSPGPFVRTTRETEKKKSEKIWG